MRKNKMKKLEQKITTTRQTLRKICWNVGEYGEWHRCKDAEKQGCPKECPNHSINLEE